MPLFIISIYYLHDNKSRTIIFKKAVTVCFPFSAVYRDLDFCANCEFEAERLSLYSLNWVGTSLIWLHIFGLRIKSDNDCVLQQGDDWLHEDILKVLWLG